MYQAGFNVAWDASKEILNNPYVSGSMQAFGGLAETYVGAKMLLLSAGTAAPLGWPIMAHGLDHFYTGMNTVFSGMPRQTMTSQLIQQTGISPQNANLIDNGISIFVTIGGAAYVKVAQTSTPMNFNLPANTVGSVSKSFANRELSCVDINKLSRAGQVLDRNYLTKAGRAIVKHGDRPGSVFPKVKGSYNEKI